MIHGILLRRAALLALPLLLATYLVSACSQSAATKPMIAYPQTKRGDVVEKLFGQSIADPYRWLENDVRTDQEIASWVKSQNRVTNAYLDTLPGRNIFKDRLRQLYNYERFTVPVKKGGRYFYSRTSGVENQPMLYVRDRVDGAGRVLIDPNGWANDGATALAEWSVHAASADAASAQASISLRKTAAIGSDRCGKWRYTVPTRITTARVANRC